MIEIRIPNSFIPERTYTISVVLGHFLGLEFTITPDETIEFYEMRCDGGTLKIADAFFGKVDNDYLRLENIPNSTKTSENQYSPQFEVFFGTEQLVKNEKNITCGTDIIASTFFMLSRWEEYCIGEKDRHERAEENEMFAVKHRLHHRPIVNEWVEYLWNMLAAIGCQQNRSHRKFDIRITHDVDHIARYDSVRKFIKALGGDLILRKNPLLMVNTIADFVGIKLGLKKDNYDTTDWLMDVSESYNSKSHFYFIPSVLGEHDARYDIGSERVKSIISNIESRGHVAGIHPSYNTFQNKEQFEIELQRLKATGAEVSEGRQHYLRFSNPETWRIWNDAGLKMDSTVGFANYIGFRAGVCYDYPVFDILRREQLSLIERPLIIMEGPLVNTYGGGEKSMNTAKSVIDQCRKYSGDFVLLWHPENFNHALWKPHVPLYKKMIEYALR